MNIRELNELIHRNLVNRRDTTPYGLLKNISKQVTFGIKIPDRRVSQVTTTMDMDTVIKTALDFFKSLDLELYEKAKEIIENRSKFSFKIYQLDGIDEKDFEIKTEDDLPLYTRDPKVVGNEKGRCVYVPCKGTIQDVVILVHEISHTFDFEDRYIPARNLLGEVTSYTFEAMVEQYLLENKIATREDIINIEKGGIVSHYDDGVETYAKLLLMELKEKEGIISEDSLNQFKQRYKIDDRTFEFIIGRMMGGQPEVDYRARYMTAQLIYPSVIEQYYQNPKGTVLNLKQYFECIKENDFNGALLCLGIEPEEATIPKLIDINNKRIERLYRKKLFDVQENEKALKESKTFFEEPEDNGAMRS